MFTDKTRLKHLKSLVFNEGSQTGYIEDYPYPKDIVTGDYHQGEVFRFYVRMVNKDWVAVNEYGRACKASIGNEELRADNLFSATESIGASYELAVDKRIRNVLDHLKRIENRSAKEVHNG